MTHSRRRDVLKAAGTAVVLGGLAGCAEQNNTGTGSGQEGDGEDTEGQQDEELAAFRVVHASPDAPNVDIYFDDEAVFEDVGYGTVTSYAEVEPGTYQVQVTAAGDQDTVVFDEEIEVEGGMTSTAVAYGEAAGGPETGFAVEVLDDDLTDPGEGMSQLRLFHAVPDAQEVDVVVTQAPEEGGGGGDGGGEQPPEGETDGEQPQQTQQEEQPENGQQTEPLFEGVSFGETVSETVPAGDYTLGVVPAGGGQEGGQPEETQQEDGQQPEGEPVAEFDATLEGQTVYSAFALGYVNPEEADADAEFQVVVVEDAQAGERADGGSDGGGMMQLSH
jgi:hypothetical protein